MHPNFYYYPINISANGNLTCSLLVAGFARRFWQGNETHRGVPGNPGRVATLVEEKGVVTFGLALELTGEDALDYLNNREVSLGGYNQHIAMFQPANSKAPPFPVLVYVATAGSSYWLGPAPPHEIAEQVRQHDITEDSMK